MANPLTAALAQQRRAARNEAGEAFDAGAWRAACDEVDRLLAIVADVVLMRAYEDEVAREEVGVNYYLVQELERRRLRNPATAELTPRGEAVRTAVAVAANLAARLVDDSDAYADVDLVGQAYYALTGESLEVDYVD